MVSTGLQPGRLQDHGRDDGHCCGSAEMSAGAPSYDEEERSDSTAANPETKRMYRSRGGRFCPLSLGPRHLDT